jgi:hypothetical protein
MCQILFYYITLHYITLVDAGDVLPKQINIVYLVKSMVYLCSSPSPLAYSFCPFVVSLKPLLQAPSSSGVLRSRSMERSEGAGDVNNMAKRTAEKDASATSRAASTISATTSRLSSDPGAHGTPSLPTPPLSYSGPASGHNDGPQTSTVALEDTGNPGRECERVEASASGDQVDLAVAERLCLETTVPWAWDSARDYCKTFLSSLWDSRLNEGSAVGRSIRAARREAAFGSVMDHGWSSNDHS